MWSFGRGENVTCRGDSWEYSQLLGTSFGFRDMSKFIIPIMSVIISRTKITRVTSRVWLGHNRSLGRFLLLQNVTVRPILLETISPSQRYIQFSDSSFLGINWFFLLSTTILFRLYELVMLKCKHNMIGSTAAKPTRVQYITFFFYK